MEKKILKEVKAIIQPFMLNRVVDALKRIDGLPGLTVDVDVHGFGRNRAAVARHKITLEDIEYAKKAKLEIVVADEMADEVEQTILKHAHTGNIRVAFFLNLAFTILEIIGGFWTNSLAILSDALHDFGDSLSLGLAWYLDKYSQKGHDKKYSYGYRRFSLLAALINTVVLIIGSLFILSEAVTRIMAPEHSNAPGMLVFAIASIVVNGLAVLRVKGDKSLNARLVAWHLLENVVGWLAVLVVSIVLLFKDVHLLDPILSMLITLYVLFNVIRNLKKTLTLFLQGVPEQIDLDEIERRILAIDGVESVHHTHVWSLDGEHHILTVHVVVGDNTAKDQSIRIKNEIKSQIETMDFEHITIEIEYGEEYCGVKRG